MWINPVLWFQDRVAYYHIATGRTVYPTIRLCAVGDSLHWTLAYGVKKTESLFWSNFYFHQIDNGALVGVPSTGSYTQVDWWNPWLKVWD